MSFRVPRWLVAGLPLWAYVLLFKAGASLYYTALSPLGERVLPLWAVGLLIGGASLLQLVLDVPAGFLLDRYGYRPFLKASSLILAAGGALLVVFGLQPWVYILLIILSGFGWLFFGPGVDAYVLSTAPMSAAGRYMGMRRSVSSLGMVVAMGFFALLVARPDALLGAVIAVNLVGSFVAALFLKKEPASAHAVVKVETHHYYIRRVYLRETLKAIRRLNPASSMLACSRFCAATFFGVLWLVLPLYLSGLAQPGALGFGLSVFDVTTVLSGGLFGRIADTDRKRLAIFFGLLLFATCAVLLGFHLNGWFLVFGFLAATGDDLSNVSLWAWMNRLSRTHAHDGVIAALVTFFEDLGWVVGPILGGLLYETVGISWAIVIGSGFVCVSWAVGSVLLYRHRARHSHGVERPSVPPRWLAHKE